MIEKLGEIRTCPEVMNSFPSAIKFKMKGKIFEWKAMKRFVLEESKIY